jgi:signal transduction histidine kinase
LAQDLGEPVDIYEASLDAARFADPEKEAPFVDFLKSRFQTRRLALIAPVGAPAVRFMAKYRETLFADTPLLFIGADPRLVPPGTLRTNATLATQKVNLTNILEDILQLKPDTTNLVVVFGASPLEKFWVSECRQEFQPFTNRLAFTWFNDLPLDQILERARSLPPRTFIVFGMLITDAAGVPYDNDEAFRRLHAVANAPIFGFFSSQFGLGAIGGRLYQDTEVGLRAARAAIRILRGERPEGIPPQILEAAEPVYDWRELRRWGISETSLPPKSVIRFRQPSFWGLYRWRVIGVALLCLLQSGLIIGLLMHRSKRRRAEQAAHDLAGRLITAQEEERGRLARELHDDITQRVALLALEAAQVEHQDPASPRVGSNRKLRERLAQLSEDIHTLSYRLHPSVLDDLGLGEGLRMECERLAGSTSLTVNVNLAEGCARPPADIALCLFRVAQEALRNVVRHANATVVRISVRKLEGGFQLIVADNGAGFDIGMSREGPSLGLASMKERVQLLGGSLEIDTAPGQGTAVLAWVPAKGTTTP